jgi:hypothetical protein
MDMDALGERFGLSPDKMRTAMGQMPLGVTFLAGNSSFRLANSIG